MLSVGFMYIDDGTHEGENSDEACNCLKGTKDEAILNAFCIPLQVT